MTLQRQIRLAQAQIMVRAAISPHYEAQLSAYFGGSGDVITAGEVKAAFGEEAAAAWMGIRTARDQFLSISIGSEQRQADKGDT